MSAAWARASLERGEAAGGLHDVGDREPRVPRAVGQRGEVGGEQGGDRGVELGGGRALVLAERADDGVGEAHVHAGEARGERLAQRLLVLGVPVGVQEADRDRLRVVRGDLLRDAGGILERPQRAAGRHPLGRADAALGRDERRRVGGAEPVEVGARLAAELDDVLEAGGGDEDGARRLALEQRVRGDRGAVGEGLDLAGGGVRALERGAHGGEDALALVVRGGRGLRRDQPPAGGDHGIGEGPSDVDPEEHDAPDRNDPAHRRGVRRPGRPLPSRPGAGATGSSRCAAAASAGTACPCGWWRGSPS